MPHKSKLSKLMDSKKNINTKIGKELARLRKISTKKKEKENKAATAKRKRTQKKNKKKK